FSKVIILSALSYFRCLYVSSLYTYYDYDNKSKSSCKGYGYCLRTKVASDACGYPDSPTRLLREVPQAPLEHRFSICGCAFISGPRAAFGGWPPKRSLRRVWRTLLTATSSPLAVVFFFLLRLGRLHRQNPIHVVLDGQQLPHGGAGLPVLSVSRFLVRQQLGILGL